MKALETLEIFSIALMYLILMFVMWTNLLADADIVNIKLQLLSGEGYGLYYFIMSTCCLFLLWNGIRFRLGREMVQTNWQRILKIVSLLLFELQIILLTFDMGLETVTIQFIIGMFSTSILGIFSFSAILDMLKGFGAAFSKKK